MNDMNRVKHKSFNYMTKMTWLQDRAGMLESEGKPSLRVASPPEFRGEAGFWTPEDLFVAAIEICQMTTFVALAERAQLPITSYTSSAEGTIEFVDGSYRFTRVVLKPVVIIANADAGAQVEELLTKAHHKCLVANSITAKVTLQPVVRISNKQ